MGQTYARSFAESGQCGTACAAAGPPNITKFEDPAREAAGLRYLSGLDLNLSAQPAQQKKKDFPACSTLCLLVAGFTSIPQTGSFIRIAAFEILSVIRPIAL